jgi:hypothetical protein
MAMASPAIRPQFRVPCENGIEGSIRGKLGGCQAKNEPAPDQPEFAFKGHSFSLP